MKCKGFLSSETKQIALNNEVSLLKGCPFKAEFVCIVRKVINEPYSSRQFSNLPDNNLFSSSSISGTFEQGTIL